MPCYVHPTKGVVFVRVPKTGSSSIRRQFFGKPLAKHRIFGPIPKEHRHLKSFAYVRHPVARFASAIVMFKKHKTSAGDPRAQKFAQSLCADALLDLLEDDNIKPGKHDYFRLLKLHAIPMTHEHFSLDLVKRIFRYERFEEEWVELAGYIGVPAPALIHTKSSKGRKPSFTDAEEDRIRRFFAADFERFGYT